jgi:hypothetical protein
MPIHETVKYSGVVGDVFAHRFILATGEGNVLADLGPKGAELFRLKKGDAVHIAGEKKPSEVKVHTIARDGEPAIVIDHPKKGPPHHEHADPLIALRAADAAGFTAVGEPHRKPKHFKLRARDAKGQDFELHIELDGRIRKQKPIGMA